MSVVERHLAARKATQKTAEEERREKDPLCAAAVAPTILDDIAKGKSYGYVNYSLFSPCYSHDVSERAIQTQLEPGLGSYTHHFHLITQGKSFPPIGGYLRWTFGPLYS